MRSVVGRNETTVLPDPVTDCDICWARVQVVNLDAHRQRHSEVHSPWLHEAGLNVSTERGVYLLGVAMRDANGFVGSSYWRDEGYTVERAYWLAWDALNAARALPAGSQQ